MQNARLRKRSALATGSFSDISHALCASLICSLLAPRSDLTQKLKDLSELREGQDLTAKDWICRCAGRSEEAKRKMAELEELQAEDEKKLALPT